MPGSQNLLTDGESAPEQQFGFFVPALGVAKSRPLVKCLGHIGMVRPQALFAHGERSTVEFLCLVVFPFGSSKIAKMVKTVSDIGVIATLRKVEFPQFVEAGCDIVMGRPQRAFEDDASTLVEWLGLLVFALKIVEHGQIIEYACHVGMIWSQRLFLNGQSLLVERFSLLVLAPAKVE